MSEHAIEALQAALEEWVFLYKWRADGMNVEQARIHAEAYMDEVRAALRITGGKTAVKPTPAK